jgi:hypothetical protein
MSNYQIDRQMWSKLSIFEQMGNIYSEVGRTFNAQKMNKNQQAQDAAIRAFDLFDATSEQLAQQKSPRLREVLRVREIFAGEYSKAEPTTLDSYFMQFAIAARLQK